MKLTGNPKKQTDKANSKDDRKNLIERAGMALTDDEMDMVAGGTGNNGENTDLRARAMEAINLVNESRREAGLPELEWNADLEDV